MVINNTSIPSHYPPPPAPDLFNLTPLRAGQAPPPKQHHAGATETVTENDARIDAMLAYLRGKGWVKRDVVFAAIKVSDRVGRALKAASGGLVISDSQHGYKHILDADPAEFKHAENEIRSRIDELTSYLESMQHVFHNREVAA